MYSVKSCAAAFAAGILSLGLHAGASQAATVTHGNLTHDDTTNVIVDSSAGRQYTAFDAFNLSVADTEAAIASGGAYEGWSIATSAIADAFIAAVLGQSSSPCDGSVSYGTVCGTVSGWSDGDLGASFSTYYDYFGYYSTNGGTPIGLVEFRQDGTVRDYENWASVSSLDYYGGIYSSNPINLLLYRELAPVPVPASGLLLLGGFAGFAALRRQRRSVAA